jgi:aminopeptidase N
VKRHRVVAEHVADTFYFYNLSGKPELVNVDATKTLLCSKDDMKEIAQFVYQYYHAPKYMDRLEAIKACAGSTDDAAIAVIIDAMGDKYWNLRETAMKSLKKAIKKRKPEIKTKLTDLAQKDPKSDVRAEAVKQLSKHFEEDKDLITVYQNAIKDESYQVMAQGMKSLAKLDGDEGLKLARSMKSEKNGSIKSAVAEILVEFGTEEDHAYFTEAIKNLGNYESFSFLPLYGEYLKKQSDADIEKGIKVFEEFARSKGAWYDRFMGLQMLSNIQAFYESRSSEFKSAMESHTAAGKTSDAQIAEQEMMKAKKKADEINTLILEIRKSEEGTGSIQIIHED